jgi:type IV pilus assembly protein PilM
MQLPQLPAFKLNINLGPGRRGGSLVGLDIQPGLVAAVQAHAAGSIVVEKAAAVTLAPDTLRDGEVNDDEALIEALRELFKDSGMNKRVRIGIANQRTVLRILELPPVTDPKELEAAVNFQAQEQIPMPLNNAVKAHQALGVVDTPAGPRQRVVLVAAQRDMVERLLNAVESAGLTPEGVDLSAFALIRSLHTPDPAGGEQSERVMYLNVDGITNLAIAEGPVCRFTRVVGGGIEAMAAELAAKREITVAEARGLLLNTKLQEPGADEDWPTPEHSGLPEGAPASSEAMGAEAPVDGPATPPAVAPAAEEPAHDGVTSSDAAPGEVEHGEAPHGEAPHGEAGHVAPEHLDGEHVGSGYGAPDGSGHGAEPQLDEMPFEEGFGDEDYQEGGDADIWGILESGIRDIYGEVRNSLDFHRSQEGGGEVSHVVLSGCAQDIPGFADALQTALGVEVVTREVRLADGAYESVSRRRLAVAAGLAVEDISR